MNAADPPEVWVMTCPDWKVVERPATAVDVELGYAEEVGQILWLEADTGALIF